MSKSGSSNCNHRSRESWAKLILLSLGLSIFMGFATIVTSEILKGMQWRWKTDATPQVMLESGRGIFTKRDSDLISTLREHGFRIEFLDGRSPNGGAVPKVMYNIADQKLADEVSRILIDHGYPEPVKSYVVKVKKNQVRIYTGE